MVLRLRSLAPCFVVLGAVAACSSTTITTVADAPDAAPAGGTEQVEPQAPAVGEDASAPGTKDASPRADASPGEPAEEEDPGPVVAPPGPGDILCGTNQICRAADKEMCCWPRLSIAQGSQNCQPTSKLTCGPNFAAIHCMGPTDCGSSLCCSQHLKGSSALVGVFCASSCTPTNPDYYGVQVCNPLRGSADCPAGKTCKYFGSAYASCS